jgi:hypothetical protein
MRIFKLGAVAGLALALAGCPDRDRDVAVVDDPTARDAPAATAEQRADAPVIPADAERTDLQAVAGSGVSGEVAVAARDNDSHVWLTVRNAQPNESLGARVQSGTCESPGPELARLDAVRTDDFGMGHSESSVGHAPHLILDGNHIAAVYAPGADAERDRPIACATLPEHGMAHTPGAQQQPGTARP